MPLRAAICLLGILAGDLSPAAPADLSRKIRDAASRWSIDHRLVEAIVHVESRGKRLVESPKGAMGLMQVMPRTALDVEIHDPFNALDNLMGACRYLRLLMNQYGSSRYKNKLAIVLAAYNAGPGNVAKYNGIPPFPETRAYVRDVLAKYESLRKN